MKGVIIAGGKGKRLRPLTDDLPKPMIPVLEKPVMEYCIEYLKKYEITEIAVTVQYLSEKIIDYFGDGQKFGVNLHYFYEHQPLGTAGSVKNAEEFLDEPFVAICGDLITDIDLQKGIEFHQEKNSLITIIMTEVQNPLGYGIMNTNKSGQVTHFLEKPSDHHVFSNHINTGIYVTDPAIFNLIPEGKKVDFSLELFPYLVDNQFPIYGFISGGYWVDIGSKESYKKVINDVAGRRSIR